MSLWVLLMTAGHDAAGLVNLWLNDVRSIRDKHADTLRQLRGKETINKLVELNVVRQVRQEGRFTSTCWQAVYYSVERQHCGCRQLVQLGHGVLGEAKGLVSSWLAQSEHHRSRSYEVTCSN